MANTRRYGPMVRLDSGLMIPANTPAKGKVWMATDAEGHGEWARKIEERTYAISGVLAEKLYPGFFIRLGSGEKKLIAVEYAVAKGEEAEFELRKNAEAATGFTALKAKETAAETKPGEALALAAKDLIRVKVIKLKGTNEDISLTLFLEI